MADQEQIYEDTKAWIVFADDDGDIQVYRRCPECGRYISQGNVLTNPLGEVKFKGWKCKKHGEIQPYYERA